MARGWESKSVESQQDDVHATHVTRPALSVAERTRESRRQSLELALAETQGSLQRACHPRHREMLRLKLDALQAELGTI